MKVGRNEQCPCGSGRKYKKCCGRIDSAIEKTNTGSRASVRSCGKCALCCHGWLTTNVLGNDVHLNQPCPYAAATHCTIHKTRPQSPCRDFFCGWVEEGSALPDWMKPNVCGVIVLTGRMSWRKHPVDILVSTHSDPDERMLSWYRQYCRKTLRPFIYQQNNQWFGFGPADFQRDIANKVLSGEPLWDGSLDTIQSLDRKHPAIENQ